MVLISETKVAHIGGQRSRGGSIIGDTIDTMDFFLPDDPNERLDVIQLGWTRKHLSCAQIEKGPKKPAIVICKFKSMFVAQCQHKEWDIRDR